MRKILSTMAAFVLAAQMCLFPAYAAPEWPNDTGVLAEGGIVIDADSGAMLFGQNVRLQYYPASITKILTALVVLENASLDEQVSFSHEAVYDVEEGSGNKVGLEEGDVLSVEDCLYAMLLMSSNQAANALAEHVGGSRQGFVDMMNARIAQIGCTGSQFRNPSGLNDPEQVVTPYDMAMIAREAFDNEALLEIASARSYRLPATINNPEGRSLTAECRILNTTDPDSQYYFPDAVAAKTGYTSLAGNTLVLYAERDGRSVISVVLKGSQPQYYFDSISLLDFGLRQFQNVNILEHDPGFTSGEEPVTIGDRTFAPSELSMDADAVITIPDDAAFTDAVRSVVTELPSYAPAGAVALIQYHYNDRKVGEVYLIEKAVAEAAAAAAQAQAGDGETSEADADAALSDAETEPAGQPEAAVPAATGSEPEGQGGFPVGIAAALGIVALAGGGGVFFVMHRRAEEARQAALRRQRRRERLMEDGCEEEFERLLKERLNRPAAGRSERSGKREGTERNGRTERNERAERNERTERHEKTERRGTTENDERSI